VRLERATALVTGANSGIGQAVSSHFRREGARLLLTGRRERLDSPSPTTCTSVVISTTRRSSRAWPARPPTPWGPWTSSC